MTKTLLQIFKDNIKLMKYYNKDSWIFKYLFDLFTTATLPYCIETLRNNIKYRKTSYKFILKYYNKYKSLFEKEINTYANNLQGTYEPPVGALDIIGFQIGDRERYIDVLAVLLNITKIVVEKLDIKKILSKYIIPDICDIIIDYI